MAKGQLAPLSFKSHLRESKANKTKNITENHGSKRLPRRLIGQHSETDDNNHEVETSVYNYMVGPLIMGNFSRFCETKIRWITRL